MSFQRGKPCLRRLHVPAAGVAWFQARMHSRSASTDGATTPGQLPLDREEFGESTVVAPRRGLTGLLVFASLRACSAFNLPLLGPLVLA